jgi:hypothetical protein
VDNTRDPRQPTLLCISPSFSPDTTPTAIRASKLLERLSSQWNIAVLSETSGPQRRGRVRVEVVRSRRPKRLLAAVRRARLSRLLEIFLWPDESIFWVAPAVLAGRRLVRELSPSAIVVFMMPYSAGLAGVALSGLTGVPLILNLDDSPTCTDMHPTFPTRLHYRASRALENLYARRADAIVYVSQTNLDAVRPRAPERVRPRFHLVRYGGDRPDPRPHPQATADFEIAYVGAMSGWWALIEESAPAGLLRRAYRAWTHLGRYRRAELDVRTSSPAIVGRAIIDALGEHPDWAGRVGLTIHGELSPPPVIARALAGAGVERVVTVLGPVPHDEVAPIIARADLLFLTLPARPDGSRGGRISAKTYEYLTTDRPILAAVPRGENWDYLADKPGVWLVAPDDQNGMKDVIVQLAAAKFAGNAQAFDRENIRAQISYDSRAAEFADVIRAGIAHAQSRTGAQRD